MSDVRYQRCRFAAKLPEDRRFTRGHYWVREEPGGEEGEGGLWRVGLTPWAVRLLGDFVEYHFAVAPGAKINLGQELGWLEAFKALVDIYSVGTGTFAGENPVLANNLDVISQDCYGAGWLYLLKGSVDPDLLDAQRYAILLDQAIDEFRGTTM